MSEGADCACVGLTILDILGQGIESIPEGNETSIIAQIRTTPAGTAAGPAVIAAKLGLDTTLVGAIGCDDMGDYLLGLLAKQGVNTGYMQRRAGLPTSATMLAVNGKGERPNFHAVGASILLEIDDETREHIVRSRFVHWGGVGTMSMLDDGAGAEILEEARSNGAVTTCDFVAPGPQTLAAIKLVLPHVSYFMPSLDEAQAVAGTTTPKDTARFYLDLGADVSVFKWGAKGSLISTRSGLTRIPAFSVAVVDTTGCGDSYCAGFIAGLHRGFDPHKACRFGTAVAALVATGLGSDAGVNNFDETEKLMDTLPVLEA